MTPKFVLCPRCELNYMPNEPDRKYCDVCLAELRLIDPSVLIPDDDIEQVLCPRCKINYMSPDDDMCEACREQEAKRGKDIEPDWSEFTEDTEEVYDDDPVEISFEDLADEEEEAERDENEPEDEENPEYPDPDDDYDLPDDDFDDLDDEDEDDEDDEDEDGEDDA